MRIPKSVLCSAAFVAVLVLACHIAATKLLRAPLNVLEDGSGEKLSVSTNTGSLQGVEELRQIGAREINIGQEGDEVHRLLSESNLELMFLDFSSMYVVRYYGTGDMADPVLKVTLRKQDGLLYVTKFDIES